MDFGLQTDLETAAAKKQKSSRTQKVPPLILRAILFHHSSHCRHKRRPPRIANHGTLDFGLWTLDFLNRPCNILQPSRAIFVRREIMTGLHEDHAKSSIRRAEHLLSLPESRRRP